MESLNQKIQSSSKDFINSVQNVGVYAYDARENVQAFRRVPANKDGALITEDISGYEEFFGSAQIEIGSAAATAVLLDSTIIPTEGLDGRHGWQFKNTVGGTAYNINYFDGASEQVTPGDLQSVYTRMFIDRYDIANQGVDGVNPEVPRIEVYTKPTGVGDFDPTYHSRWIYAVDTRTQHIGIFEDCVFYAIGGPSKRFGERSIPMNVVTLEGDGDLNGEILKIVVSSPTTAPAASIDVCVNMVGWENNSTTAPLARAYRLVYPNGSAAGDATAANQVLQLNQETVIADNTSSIDGKITVGSDDSLTEAQQVLVYGRKDASPSGLRAIKTDFEGRVFVENEAITTGSDTTLSQAQQVLVYGEVTSGPGTGDLHPIHISQAGDVQVEISGLEVKGQQVMADSLPVVIASDQSAITVSETFLRNLSSQTLNVPAGGDATSNGINMSPSGNPTYRKIAYFGETDNVTDLEMPVEFSNNNSDWFPGGYMETIQLALDPNDPTRQTYYKVIDCVPQYIRLHKYNSTASAETVTIKVARIN